MLQGSVSNHQCNFLSVLLRSQALSPPTFPRPKLTIATALVFFHRFYSRQSFKYHDRFVSQAFLRIYPTNLTFCSKLIANTCLHLAGKVEETPQKLSRVIEITYKMRNEGRLPATQQVRDFLCLCSCYTHVI